MNKTKLDMSAIMAEYTAKVNREAAYRQAVIEGRLPAPKVQSGNWNISDRD